ncbi:HEPN-associated N-terminal domain-containing protein [Pseudomonas quasicaspiana]|uniref:HEPN-associated N-terminal domain-containing protein n=1 Tax=Pseudomonas quasicaspiana TaxID=2829821 RepID=UPI001E645FBA|nr:HEPN-associated N-terminal domain-containing protein [Pseudomonas quasicaspiana]MCD5976742.1 RES domain-containing protein [Pseudomonas quasicaspiana]
MGLAKRAWMEEMERGYSLVDDAYVCAGCYQEEGVKKFIKRYSVLGKCSYCGRKKKVCPLNDVIEHIAGCIRLEWGDPNNEGLPWESREGGWQFGNVCDTWDLLHDLELTCESETLNDDIIGAFHQSEWCRVNPYSVSPDRTLLYGWEKFSKFIIHTARFVFYKAENTSYDRDQHDEMNPVDILDALGNIVDSLNLVRTVPAGRKIYRVRIANQDVHYTQAKELGSPPGHLANMPNRMSPVGISMFYGAFDLDTAIKETFDHSNSDNKKAVCGHFAPTRDLTVIDLSESYIPSLFDPDERESRYKLKFLCDFIDDFSKPIERGDKAHADYVPTQVVTEYFRHIYRTENGNRVDGIIYRSSKNNVKAIVIFADSTSCVDPKEKKADDALLVLRKVSDVDLATYVTSDDDLAF